MSQPWTSILHLSRAWKAAFEAVSAALLAKQSSPLEQFALDPDVSEKVAAYQALRRQVGELSDALVAANEQIAIVKERAAAGNIAALEEDLRKLRAIEARFQPDVAPLCDDYLAEKERKLATEKLRDEARQALDQYRNEEFPAYEEAINRYLGHFNAGYRLHQVTSVNTRVGSSCNYSVLIGNTPVPLSAAGEGEPSFRNTLSAGDRNALALAFFFASLERDPGRARKIVVIDDPMTSLDEHRALTTVQQMRQLLEDVEQVIVLSHSKPFLCGLWEGADTDIRSALKIVPSNPGSSFASWDVTQDCITEHDRRHRLVRNYLEVADGPDERAVAAALRPILEAYMRVCYPEWFPPGALLGQLLGVSQQYEGTPNEILSREDRIELRRILDYANLFHHDKNSAWQTATINDAELNMFARRTLAFTRRETRP